MMEYNKNSQKQIRELSGMFPFPSRCNIWTLIEVLCCVVKRGGSLRMNKKGVSWKLEHAGYWLHYTLLQPTLTLLLMWGRQTQELMWINYKAKKLYFEHQIKETNLQMRLKRLCDLVCASNGESPVLVTPPFTDQMLALGLDCHRCTCMVQKTARNCTHLFIWSFTCSLHI